jgi:hypothetical protein
MTDEMTSNRLKLLEISKKLLIDYQNPEFIAKMFLNMLMEFRAIEHGYDICNKSIQSFIMSKGLTEDVNFSEFEKCLERFLPVYYMIKLSDLLKIPEEYAMEIVKAEINRHNASDKALMDKLRKAVSGTKQSNQEAP